jgi:hypothetical protein
MVSEVLSKTVDKPWCDLVSYQANLHRVERRLLNVPTAWGQFRDLRNEIIAQAEQLSRSGPMSVMTQLSKRPAAPRQMGDGMGRARFEAGGPGGRRRPRSPDEVFDSLAQESYPTWWSLAVLAGLFGASVCILTQRVRSLDRLK